MGRAVECAGEFECVGLGNVVSQEEYGEEKKGEI